MKNKKEPVDYAIDIFLWVMTLPLMLTTDSDKKWVRVVGLVLLFPYVVTWVFTGIPVCVVAFVLIIVQLFKDI